MSARVIHGNLSLISAPTLYPITVAEAKEQSRVLEDAEEFLIESYIETATGYLDGQDGILVRALTPQTWDYRLPCFPIESWITLPLAPVQSIVSITYKDTNDNPQTFGASNYALSPDKYWQPKVHLAPSASWPSTQDVPDAVTVQAIYGYTTVPYPIRQAIVLLVAHWFENREPVNSENMSELPFGVAALLEPYMRASF